MSATFLESLDTPAAIVDLPRLQHNIARMQEHMNALGVALRPHVKTTKCLEVAQAQIAAGARGITVSTLKEAEQFFAAGITDILYAVSMAPAKLPRALALKRAGCNLKIIVDNVAGAEAIVAACREAGETLETWIEIDTDGHRSGITPEQPELLDVARALDTAGLVGGVLTHAGSSYELNDDEALAALAEVERAGCVRAAERIREIGIACPNVSVGSTPTALAARALPGVTEVRAGVYAFFDLV
ncbi:MAG: alanine racemase, partial [Bordetella sp.]|nr:alanine racemase [Bordetella sp.]